jgi:hypothetical protein
VFYLGTIDAGAAAVKDNSNCTTPFVIPKGTKKLVIQPDITGMFFAVNRQAAQTPLAAVMNEMATAKERITVELGDLEAEMYLIVRNPTGGAGNVKVFRVR